MPTDDRQARSAACDHCDDTGEVLEPSRTPEEPGYMIPCANCQDDTAARDHIALATAGGGGGAPKRKLFCGCWETEIVGMDGQRQWIVSLACEEHRGR